jgi:plastocyanin
VPRGPIGILLCVAAIGLSSACASDDGTGRADTCADPVATDVVSMDDDAYEPDCIGVDRGSQLTVKNDGDLPHTFTVKGTEIDLDVKKGKSAEIDSVDLSRGAFVVFCTYHPELSATLMVE